MVSYIVLFFSLFACAPTLQSDLDTSIVEDTEEIILGVQTSDSCGQNIGDKVCDLMLYDQHGELWRLYNLEGNVMVLDFSAMWCGPCQNAAATVQQTQDDYETEGFSYITVLIDDPAADIVELDDVQSWADTHGIETAPVLQGSRDLIDYSGIEGYPIASWPTFVFIDRELNVYWGIYGFNEEYIRTQIEEML